LADKRESILARLLAIYGTVAGQSGMSAFVLISSALPPTCDILRLTLDFRS
jgi:hypothetical protein